MNQIAPQLVSPAERPGGRPVAEEPPRTGLAAWLHAAVFFGLIALLLFGPLALGAVEPWSQMVLEVGSAVLFLLWAAGQAMDGVLRVRYNRLYLPMIAFAAVVLVQLAATSVYRYATFDQLMLYASYGVLFFLAVQCLYKPQRFSTFLAVFTAFGFALVIFSLVHHFTFNHKLYWVRPLPFGGGEWAPYVNRNHYAGLMEMLIPFPLVMCVTGYLQGSRRALAGFAAAVMMVSVFLSLSRGGMVALVMEGALLVALGLRQKRRAVMIAAVAVVAVAAALLLWMGTGPLVERFENVHDETRAAIVQDSVRMIARRPVLGWGLGTFTTVYPQFRRYYTDYFVNAAHNDYIEALVDTGLLGFATVLWFLFGLYRNAWRHLGPMQSSAAYSAALGALIGCTGLLVHSFVDFNLHIPANAALFYVLCAIASSPLPRARTIRWRRPAAIRLP